jgi:acetoin utilization deacetylase AcuC-like enzyme
LVDTERCTIPQLGLVFFPAFDWAISPDHPEREERLLYTRDQLVEEGLLDLPGVMEFRPKVATENDLKRTHICIPSIPAVLTKAHLIAAGGCITAAKAVMEQKVKKAFALLRPPGHHAMRLVHGARGFCTINNEAILIEYIRKHYGSHLKIAVVDTDAHHADGSQDIFYNDPGVLHISLHQDGRTLYPGTGNLDELGGPGAYGLTLNIPLPPGSGDRELLFVTKNLVLPVLEEFQPDLVINGAGQDNHYSDPLTHMQVTAQGYAELNKLLQPDLVVLEGGYAIEGALPYVNVAIILALLGMDYSRVLEPDGQRDLVPPPPGALELVKKEVAYLRGVWAKRREIDLDKIFGTAPYYRRERRIYYDTDDILEHQVDQIKRCNKCSGYRVIYSRAQKRVAREISVAVVHLPWHVCADCRAEAESAYERLHPDGGLDRVYLQDVEKDVFLEKQ